MNTTGQVMPNGDTVYYEDSKARDMFADAYDSTKSYAVGNHCIKDDVLYVCNTAIPSGGETWNSAHWTATTYDAEVSALKSNLADKNTVLTPTFNTAYFSASDITNSHVNYVLIGKVCVVAGRFTFSTNKPSGQGNYLMKLPAPRGLIIPVKVLEEVPVLLINQSGELTANSSVSAGTYNIMCSYIIY